MLCSGPWDVLGVNAVTQTLFVPDFTAVANENVQLFQVSRKQYEAALSATKYEREFGRSTAQVPAEASLQYGSVSRVQATTSQSTTESQLI